MSSDGLRHVPLPVIESYLADDVEGVLGVDGEPEGRLVIDPHRGTLAVRLPVLGEAPELVDFENVAFEEVVSDGQMWHEIAVRLDDNVDEVYALLCVILDRVQLLGEDFGDAVLEALDSLTGILALRRGLSIERRVGLFGELLTYRALAGEVGAASAIAAWRGPLAEEHDFGLLDHDLEVKTTLGERRVHWISTATQLARTGARTLYLLSLQITSAGLGKGLTLPELVAAVRAMSDNHGHEFDLVLRGTGYRDRDADLYRSRWTLRTSPAFYEVDDEFPAVTQAWLDASVPSAHRVTDLRYRIDLSAMAESLAPFSME